MLPLRLLLGFRTLVDELHVRLADRGHPDARPMHGFVCQAIGADGASAAALGQRLGISKQAAGKLVDGLAQLGYVNRAPDATDARRKHVTLSPRGDDLLAQSARIFDELRAEWSAVLGADRLLAIEDDLERVAGGGRLSDIPGWFSRA